MKTLPKLTKNETNLFFATKNIPMNGYDEKKILSFEIESENEILNDYPIMADTFQRIVSIPLEFVFIENINLRLIEIAEKINPKILKNVLMEISKYRKSTHSQAIFKSLYGYLQAVQVYELEEDGTKKPLIDFDDTDLKE